MNYRIFFDIVQKDGTHSTGLYNRTAKRDAEELFDREVQRAETGVVQLYKNGKFVKSKRINQ